MKFDTAIFILQGQISSNKIWLKYYLLYETPEEEKASREYLINENKELGQAISILKKENK